MEVRVRHLAVMVGFRIGPGDMIVMVNVLTKTKKEYVWYAGVPMCVADLYTARTSLLSSLFPFLST